MYHRSPRHPHAEDGFALPTVLFMLLAAFGIASLAVISSINTQQGTGRDVATKEALAAAEAGVQQALVRYNAAAASGSCVAPQTLQTTGPQAGWCTAYADPGGTFAYQVAPGGGVIDVVSRGTVEGVSRKVHVTAHSAAGNQPFLDWGVIGRDWVALASNADITADTATNGDLTFGDGASTFLCGNIQVGVGHAVLPVGTAPSCGGQVLQGEILLSPVNQADVRTNNSNAKFFSQNPITGTKTDVCWNGVNGSGAASTSCGSRELLIDHNSGVTLTSGNYSFCKLTMRQNSVLQVASGSTVRIYFDSPEACGYASGVVQLDMTSNTEITANGTSGATDFALLFVGSESRSTSINLASNTLANQACNQNFVVYAPRTSINFASNASYCGAIAGKTIGLNSNAHVETNNLAAGFELPNAPAHYTIDRFVECSAQTTTIGC
jgi:hypothetical protein